jgi:drug/metabolite transporter (DMT)-like permease
MLALGAAAFYGSADFVGGLASRRTAALTVALGAQVSGLVVLAVALPLLGPTAVTHADLAFGAAAGLFGGIGLVVILRSLARGPMSVVAPTSALSAASVPVLIGLALGERPGLSVLAGIAIALVAVVLITREKAHPDQAPASFRGALLPALAGGALFGIFFTLQHQTGDGAGLWPLLAARAVSVPLLLGLASARRIPLSIDRSLVGPVLVSGGLDMVANIFFLFATRHGMLAVVSALTGLYPASTVVLAQTRLGERMQPTQVLGLGVAALAAVMVAT